MPGLLFTSKLTKTVVDQKIEHAKELLINIEELNQKRFLLLLQQRVSDFETELSSDQISLSEKEHILEQYNRFAKTLVRCLTHPHNTDTIIFYYHKQVYYPVGIKDTEKPDQLTQNLAYASFGLGLSLLIASIPAFILMPPLGAGMLSIALTLLFPSCYLLLLPNSPDIHKKKEEEKQLFQEGAKLIKPELIFEDTDPDDTINEVTMNQI